MGRSRISRDVELPLFGGSSPVEMFALMKMVIFRLLREIVDPLLPFVPATDKKKACPSCDFQYICGTQWVVK